MNKPSLSAAIISAAPCWQLAGVSYRVAANGARIVIFNTSKDRWLGSAKNAVMQLSPLGIPLILYSTLEESRSRSGYIFYSTDRGGTCHEGVRRIEPISFKFPMAYGVCAANVVEEIP